MVKELAENKPRVILIGHWHKIISTVLHGNERKEHLKVKTSEGFGEGVMKEAEQGFSGYVCRPDCQFPVLPHCSYES